MIAAKSLPVLLFRASLFLSSFISFRLGIIRGIYYCL